MYINSRRTTLFCWRNPSTKSSACNEGNAKCGCIDILIGILDIQKATPPTCESLSLLLTATRTFVRVPLMLTLILTTPTSLSAAPYNTRNSSPPSGFIPVVKTTCSSCRCIRKWVTLVSAWVRACVTLMSERASGWASEWVSAWVSEWDHYASD